VSGERAAAVFGYRPTPFETTIADAYAWFRDRGMLDHSG
jgi:nucleoside-diphosphate-sugar epimerase